MCSGVKTTHYVIVTTKELEKSEGNVGDVCDIITHQGQAGFQDMVAVVWETVSECSPAAHLAPAARLWPGSWLMWRWAWRGCNSNNDVRSLPR